MATYTYDITNDIGKVRLLIGDTDIVPTTDAQFSDEEIQAFLTMGGSVLMAASLCLESWASAISGNMTQEKIGDYSYTKKDAETKTALAKKYREEDASTPVFEIASPDLTAGSAITAEED